MTYEELEAQAQARYLTILGGFHNQGDNDLPDNCQTLLLLGPHEARFWLAFIRSPESTGVPTYCPDPMDSWSRRVIGGWAKEIDAEPLFPFGGPPYLPFYAWALRTGRIHASPVNFLVHDHAGLFVSFRGALALQEKIDLPETPPNPCDTCERQPCLTACPVDALNEKGYDVPACKTYLDTAAGTACMTQGCAVRRACPVSQSYNRLPAQSEYHMRHFKGD